MVDENITDSDRRRFREENQARVVSTKNDRMTMWASDPGQRQREMEELNQGLASEGSGELNPWDHVSDGALWQAVQEQFGRG